MPTNSNEPIKMTSTGTVKDPATGASTKASDSNPAVNETPAQKAMREAKAKLTSTPPKENKATADNPNPNALKPDSTPVSDLQKEEESQELNEENANNQPEKPLEEGITGLSGKMTDGSFAIEFKKSGVLIRIPVSMETSRDTYTLDNTFKLVKEIQGVKSKKELEERFASFLPEGV